jgi:methylmalonyl-CoA mutase C-terminal domain/subunit
MRRAKILIAVVGLDQHEVGALSIARALRDAGMEVVYTGRFNLPPAIVEAALEEGVDLIGLSAHSWEYLHYIDEILQGLREAGLDIPVVLGGSVITPPDEKALLEKGVAAAFGPSSTIDRAVDVIRDLVGHERRL